MIATCMNTRIAHLWRHDGSAFGYARLRHEQKRGVVSAHSRGGRGRMGRLATMTIPCVETSMKRWQRGTVALSGVHLTVVVLRTLGLGGTSVAAFSTWAMARTSVAC